MSLHTFEAILLDVFDLHDQDRIVTLLTRERGKVRGVARAARRKYSRFAGQLQPLSTVRVTWFERSGSDLVRLSSVESVRTADAILRDLEGILLAGYLAEHMLEFAQENEESHRLYRLLDSTVEALLTGIDRDLVTRYFEAWVLRLAGVFPVPTECPACDRELGDEARRLPAGGEGLLCESCGEREPGAKRVSVQAVRFLMAIATRSLQRMSEHPQPAALLAEVADVNARVRRAFLQKELKSHRVMHETLARVGGA